MMALRGRVSRLVRGRPRDRRLPTVLMLGETGTGKGLLAQAIHRESARASGPFVAVNCAAIPDTLLEAELFGFERGAFTGACQAKPGLFQIASQGTLFLDEVGALPVGVQAKLLTVLEEQRVRRLGGTRSEPVDVWVMAATSLDPEAALARGQFRVDLYHRLAAVTFELPPLAARGADVLLLAEHFLRRASAGQASPAWVLASDARAALLAHTWPGNVRELANVIERATLLAEGAILAATDLGLRRGAADTRPAVGTGQPEPASFRRSVSDFEREAISRAMLEARGNLSRAAARLGLPRTTLRYRLGRLGLRPVARSRSAGAA